MSSKTAFTCGLFRTSSSLQSFTVAIARSFRSDSICHRAGSARDTLRANSYQTGVETDVVPTAISF
jgi:hypothetical protein